MSVGVKPAIFSDWEKIDNVETSRGEAVGKPREKLLSVEEMLQVVQKWLKSVPVGQQWHWNTYSKTIIVLMGPPTTERHG